jgi:diketogulonate reductase-like aldo/keto reductase
VAEGIRRSGIDRSDVFIESKVWISDYGYDETLHAFDKSARKLGVDQIDLFILHQPLPAAFGRTIQAYKALEKLLEDGKVRAIGVSNFLLDYLESLLERTDVVPAVNQIELHPYYTQPAAREVHERHGILTQALVADRRHHLLRPRLLQEHVLRSDDRRDRPGPWQVGSPGDAALAPAAGTLRHPQVGAAGADRGELRHLRLRALHGRARADRRARHRRAKRHRAG